MILFVKYSICVERGLGNSVDRIHGSSSILVVNGRHPQSMAVPGSPPQSPAVPSRRLQSPTLICLTLQGPPSSTKTAVLRFLGPAWTAFCRPVPSGALGSPPAGPYRGPGRLRTLFIAAHPSGVRSFLSGRLGSTSPRSSRSLTTPSCPMLEAHPSGPV